MGTFLQAIGARFAALPMGLARRLLARGQARRDARARQRLMARLDWREAPRTPRLRRR